MNLRVFYLTRRGLSDGYVIVYRAFSAHFCTAFVARLLLSDFRSERSWTHWYVMVRGGTR